MSSMPTDKNCFEPVHAAHSIEQAVLALHFDRPLDPERLKDVIEIASQFKTELPGGGPIQSGFPFAFGGPAMVIGGPAMPMPILSPQMPTTGVILQRSAPDGSIEDELRVEQAVIICRTTRYTRWTDIWEKAKKYFSSLIHIYLANGSVVSSISINFSDRYVWNGEIQDFDPGLLLNKESEFIASHIFSRKDLWHVHTGAFIRTDSKTKRLVNVNIDCLDDNKNARIRRSVLITTILTDLFNQAGFEMVAIDEKDALSFIAEHMESLHSFDKVILGKTLVNSMAKRIALIG